MDKTKDKFGQKMQKVASKIGYLKFFYWFFFPLLCVLGFVASIHFVTFRTSVLMFLGETADVTEIMAREKINFRWSANANTHTIEMPSQQTFRKSAKRKRIQGRKSSDIKPKQFKNTERLNDD